MSGVKLIKTGQLALLLLLAWLLLDLALLPRLVLADYIVLDKQVDKYHVTVWARPNPIAEGKVNLLVRLGRLTDTGQEYPVQSAEVRVKFEELPQVGTSGFAPKNYYRELLAAEADPGTYEWEDSLLSAGHFRAIIKLNSSLGQSETSFEFNAVPPPDDRLFSILLLALFPLSLLTLVYFYVRRPKNPGTGNTPSPQEQEVSSH